jgi:hypothetical protein
MENLIMSHNLRNLFDEIAETGYNPSDEEIAALVTSARTKTEVHQARRQIRIAATKIQQAREQSPTAVRNLIEGAVDGLGHYCQARGTARDLPQVERNPEGVSRAAGARHLTRPLGDLLRHAVRGPITEAELDRLALDETLTDEQRTQWKQQVQTRAREIREVYDSGSHGLARQLAVEAELELGRGVMVAPPNPSNDLDNLNPSQLADLISRG